MLFITNPLYCAAKDLYNGSRHLAIDNMADGGLIKNKVFPLIYNAILLKRNGLPRYTLIKDAYDLESARRTHLLNIRGCLYASESANKEWLAEEGKKLIDSGKGIDTEYGMLFVNEEIAFDEIFKGSALPPYYCGPNAVAFAEVKP